MYVRTLLYTYLPPVPVLPNHAGFSRLDWGGFGPTIVGGMQGKGWDWPGLVRGDSCCLNHRIIDKHPNWPAPLCNRA